MFILSLLRRLLDIASTILLVTATAALVWLFAEQKNVHDQAVMDVDLVYGTPEEQSEFLIGQTSGAPKKAHIFFRCSNIAADQVKAKLQGGGPYVIALNPADKQELSFRIKDKIQDALTGGDKKFPISNLRVENDPQVNLTVEKMVDVVMPLKLRYDKFPLEGQPKMAQESVVVRLPASLEKAWKTNFIGSLNLNNLRPGTDIPFGKETTCQIPVEFPDVVGIYLGSKIPPAHRAYFEHPIITPSSVAVSLTPEKTSSTLQLTRSVPISIVTPPGFGFEKWSFEITDQGDKYLSDLRLAGSPADLDLVLKNERDQDPRKTKLVWASARIPGELPADGNLTLKVDVMTPPGITLAPGTLLKEIKVHARRIGN